MVAALGDAGKKIWREIEGAAAEAWKHIQDYAVKLYEEGIKFIGGVIDSVKEKLLSLFMDFGKLFSFFFDVDSASIVVGEGTEEEATRLGRTKRTLDKQQYLLYRCSLRWLKIS